MPEMIENHMVEDWYWDEIEYGVPNHRRLKEQQRNYEKEEYEEEILRLRSEGKTNREICEKFGFNMKQIKTS